jgi:hypothetical protein
VKTEYHDSFSVTTEWENGKKCSFNVYLKICLQHTSGCFYINRKFLSREVTLVRRSAHWKTFQYAHPNTQNTLWTFIALRLSVLGVRSKCFWWWCSSEHEHYFGLIVHHLDVSQTTFRELDLFLSSDLRKEMFLLSWATAHSEHSSMYSYIWWCKQTHFPK